MQIEISSEYLWTKDFVLALPQSFDKDGVVLEDGRNTVKKFEWNGQLVVVKRFKRPYLYQRVVYTFFRSTKAKRAYWYAKIYRDAGIATPKEIAYIEILTNGLFTEGYFVSEYSSGTSVRAQLSGEKFSRPFADALAKCIARMHQYHILHGDLNTSNILYHIDCQGDIQFEFIDINRSRFPTAPDMRVCLDNLKRLTYQRDVLRYIVGMYAKYRQWEESYCVGFVMKRLEEFENRNARHSKIKKMFGLKKD
ncbi:MAG: lipopolysaccharide kinase InaA family protein [Bacteroidales bacterium]|nr:lipopolysaccharide kinase InaA family protein [Bacteroidales bacterium]